MGLKEQVELAKRNAQIEQVAAARESARWSQESASRRLREEAKALAETQQKFDKILKEHQENVQYIKQVANLALTYITPTLQNLQTRVARKFPYVNTKTELVIWDPKIRNIYSPIPDIRAVASDSGGSMEWRGTYVQLKARLDWGRYPDQEYSRGLFSRKIWFRADYSSMEVSMSFDSNNLDSFGNLIVQRMVPFLEWQENPSTITTLMEEAFAYPSVHKYDVEKRDEVPDRGPMVY